MDATNNHHQSAQKLVSIAPANNVSTSQQNGLDGANLMPFTCVTCAKRKVKCDKLPPPCTACRRSRQECHYQEPQPRKRKRKPVDDLQDRLYRYEKLLKDHGILPKEDDASPFSPDSNETPNSATNASVGMGNAAVRTLGDTAKKQTGKLLKKPGKTRYVDSGIWRNLGDDLHPSSDEEDVDYDAVPSQDPLSADLMDPASAAFFAIPMQNLFDLHPTYDVAMKLWKMYVRNVEPIVKAIHVPTGLDMVQRAATNPSGMSKVTECLVFSIYHFALVSTPEKECEEVFGHNWRTLQQKFHNATRQALVAVHFLRTTEFMVLQAYVLLLLSVRSKYDPHTFWILTGIAVRIGQRMGLHHDGEELGLNPFEVQIRRRLFWQLLPLDGLSGQLSGTGIAITSDSWDTKQPLNINDDDIWPGMESTPVEKKGATDMMFALARTEIGKFHQKSKPVLGNWTKLWGGSDIPLVHESLQELENIMEERYVRYCDISTPVHILTVALARGAINSARLRVRVGGVKANGATAEERKELVVLATKVLDLEISLHCNTSLDRFHWHVRSFFQWDALIWLLTEVQNKDTLTNQDDAWEKIGQVYANHPELTNWQRSVDVALARLVVKSWDAMATAWKTAGARPEPAFVQALRANFAKRVSSRQGTAQNTPAISNNLESQQPPVDDYLAANNIWAFSHIPNEPGFDAANPDDMDWMFWDQLIRNSQTFPGTIT